MLFVSSLLNRNVHTFSSEMCDLIDRQSNASGLLLLVVVVVVVNFISNSQIQL